MRQALLISILASALSSTAFSAAHADSLSNNLFESMKSSFQQKHSPSQRSKNSKSTGVFSFNLDKGIENSKAFTKALKAIAKHQSKKTRITVKSKKSKTKRVLTALVKIDGTTYFCSTDQAKKSVNLQQSVFCATGQKAAEAYAAKKLKRDSGEVTAMIKINNASNQTNFNFVDVYQTEGAYCANDSGTSGESCKPELQPGELQTSDFENSWDSSTFTYEIDSGYYNIRVSPQESGLLNENDEVVSSVGSCTGTNEFESGYTQVNIDCSGEPVPDYNAPVYSSGVVNRGVNFSGEEWESGKYYTTRDDVNKAKSIGFQSSRVPVDLTDVQTSSGAKIDWTTGVAKEVDDSIQMQLANGMAVVIFDAHNYDICWDGKHCTGEELADFWSQVGEHYADTPSVWLGIMNEPHDVYPSSGNVEDEVNALFDKYDMVEDALSKKKITNPRLYEPADWGGIANYGNELYQQRFIQLRDSSNVPENVYADGHAYGTNTDGPGGSGYGDCDPDGVSHNHLDVVATWAESNHVPLTITEYNGDPQYQNCKAFVNSTDNFMNAHAWTEKGGFVAATLWGYYLNQGSTDALDINKTGDPASDAQIINMQENGFLVPGTVSDASKGNTKHRRRSRR